MKKVPFLRCGNLSYSVYSLFLVVLVSGTLCWTAASLAGPGGLADSAWPCVGHDERHTGQSPYIGTQRDTLKWTYQLQSMGVFSSPVIGSDGTVYVGDYNTIYAITPCGNLRWKHQIPDYISSSPTIGADGTIYVTGVASYVIEEDMAFSEGIVYALDPVATNPDSRVKWSNPVAMYAILSSPAIAADGTIYVASQNDHVYALDPAGSVPKWDYQAEEGAEFPSSPAIGVDGIVYVVSSSGLIYALDPSPYPEVRVIWSNGPESGGENRNYSSPSIGADGTIYVSSSHEVDAFNLDGSLKWSLPSESLQNYCSPAIAADGMIYVGSDSNLQAIDPNGHWKWGYPAGTDSPPAIGADGIIYFGSDSDGHIYALDPTGSLKWSYKIADYAPNEADIVSSPAIAGDGTVYIVSWGKLYAFGYAAPLWPCRGYDAQHTGRSLYAGAQTNALKWRFQTGGPVESSAAIDADGTVYIGSDDQKLYAIHSNGSIRWSFTTGGEVCSSPAIGADGTIFVGSLDGRIYALDSEKGIKKWTFPPEGSQQYPPMDDVFSSPAIGPDGEIYIGSESGRIYSFDPNGVVRWTYQAIGEVISSPAISADGSTIYVGSNGGSVYALRSDIDYSPETRLKWEFTANGGFYSSPAVGGDGTVYIGSSNDSVYALDPNGNLRWRYQTEGDVDSSPAIGADGTIYVGSDDHRVYALDPNAAEPNNRVKWSYETNGRVWSSPTIGADGTIYVGSNDGYIYALRPDGSLRWSYQTGNWISSSAAIGNGLIYIGSSDGTVYAFGGVAPSADYNPTAGSASLNNDNSADGDDSSGVGCFISSLRVCWPLIARLSK